MTRRFQSPLLPNEECPDITAKSILLECEGFYYVFSEIEKAFREPVFSGDCVRYEAELEALFEKRMSFPGAMPETPKIVNGAFAVELALKYLTFIGKRTFECTHDIEKLFSGLPDVFKNELITRLKKEANQSDETLKINLRQIANYYKEWRYLFTTEGVGCTGFFYKFVRIVCDYALSFGKTE
jgi:HEPN domain.